jgi:hypothetical protein
MNILTICHKDIRSDVPCTSDYSDLSEFFTLNNAETMEWYEVKRKRIALVKCSLCGRRHIDGTSGNCGN